MRICKMINHETEKVIGQKIHHLHWGVQFVGAKTKIHANLVPHLTPLGKFFNHMTHL